MNRNMLFKLLGVSFVTFTLAFGATRMPETKVERDAKKTMQSMLASVQDVRVQSDQLVSLTRNTLYDPQAYAYQMEMIKSDFNHINRNLQALESERASLAPWQTRTIDAIVPMLKNASEGDTNAIAYFNANQHNLTAPSFRSDAKQIYVNSSQAGKRLDQSLKLARLHSEAAHITSEIAS